MVRGGRSYGSSGRSSGPQRHHHYGGGRGMTNQGQSLRKEVNVITDGFGPPLTLAKGIYTLRGSQFNVVTRLNQTEVIGAPVISTMPMGGVMPMGNQMSVQMSNTQINPMQIGQMPMNPMVPMNMEPQVVTQADISVAGTRTSQGSDCCFCVTVVLGVFLILPLFILCCPCMWFKKIIYPKYEMTVQFYRALGTFLRRERQCIMLNLTVVDNAFNAEKARVLYESLSGSSLTGFTFKNIALACNYNQSEADSFVTNMTPLKGLPFPTQISWDDMNL